MTTQLQITDACPHCGQLVMVQLACAEATGSHTMLPVIVDPEAAAIRAAHPSGDHPCPEERQT